MLVEEMQKELSYFYSVPCQESRCVCDYLCCFLHLALQFGMTCQKIILKAMLLCFYLVLTLLHE